MLVVLLQGNKARVIAGDNEIEFLVLKQLDKLRRPAVASHTLTTYPGGTEELTIQSISGRIVTLTTPLRYTHDGARDAAGTIDFLPHVGNIERNVIFRSENPDGVRGHVLITQRADADIRYSTYIELGRTRNLNNALGVFTIDGTKFDANGTATSIAANQIARYPFHTHHLVGPTSPQSNGYQYTVIGNVVDSGIGNDNKFRWGMVYHASHYGLIQDNIVYRAAGAGIVTEDGNEAHNTFVRNFAVGTSGMPDTGAHKRGASGDGFWFRSPLAYVRDNVAADNVYNGYGLFFQRNSASPKSVRIPAFQGADPKVDGAGFIFDDGPFLEFRNNEAYGGKTRKGLEIWNLNLGRSKDDQVSLIKDFKVWHLHRTDGTGIFAYNIVRVTLDGYVYRQDVRHLDSNRQLKFQIGAGAGFRDTQSARYAVIRNADIQGALVGIDIPNDIDHRGSLGEFIIEDSIIRAQTGIAYNHPYDSIDAGPRRIIVRNTRIDPLPIASNTDGPHLEIRLLGGDSNQRANYILPEKFYVYDYQGQSGNDFQIHFLSQHPESLLKQTGTINGDVGSPEAGLTNQENWDKYGIATAGGIATCLDSTTNPRIMGFVCPIN